MLTHLILSSVLLLLSFVFGILLAANEGSGPEHILPWSRSNVQIATLNGDAKFGLLRFALCANDKCSRFEYKDFKQKLSLGAGAEKADSVGPWVFTLLIAGTIAGFLSLLLTLFSAVAKGLLDTTGRTAQWMTSLVSTVTLGIAAILWAANIHAALDDAIPTTLYLSWGFGLCLVSAALAGCAMVVQCLRPVESEVGLLERV
jgi:hypothetical protein